MDATFRSEWEAFLASPLPDLLIRRGHLVPWEDEPLTSADSADAVAVLRPLELRFISYPYEWSFSQLQDAALLTLEIQRLSLEHGHTLRDATPFNVGFLNGTPIWIDTLSFTRFDPRQPWVAYRQFCEAFLAPLALMALRDMRLAVMQRDFLDGIPLDLASRLLPWSTRLSPALVAHLHLHAAAQRGQAPDAGPRRAISMSLTRHQALVDQLRRAVRRLSPRGATKWSTYSTHTAYSETAAQGKAEIVRDFLAVAPGERVIDLGANDGAYSRIAAESGRQVIAVDSDWTAIDRLYRSLRDEPSLSILPMVADVTNPTPGTGWGGRERAPLGERLKGDVVMALALVHHIAIGHNVPLDMFIDQMAAFAPTAIVEFVPKDDPMAQRLLAAREDVFGDYDLEHFLKAASRCFAVERQARIPDSSRELVLLTSRS